MRSLRYIALPMLALATVAQAQTITQKENTPPYAAAATITSTDGKNQTLSAPVIYTAPAPGTAGSSPTVASQGSTTSGQTGTLAEAAVVTGNQAYTIGTTQPLNLTPTGRLKVGVSAATNIAPAANLTTTLDSELAGCIYRASPPTWSDQWTGALGCDSLGRLNVNSNVTDSRPSIPNLYIATAAGTGYAIGDILDKIVVSQASSGAYVNSYWINRTQLTSIAAPTAGSYVAYFATAANQATMIANQTNGNQVSQVVAATSYGDLLPAGATVFRSSDGGTRPVAVASYFKDPSNNTWLGRGDQYGAWVETRGGSNIATGQVSVGTTATLIVAARANRQKVTYAVTTAVQCSYGNSGVTLTAGFPLQAVAGASQTVDTNAAIYGVCASAATVGYMEQY